MSLTHPTPLSFAAGATFLAAFMVVPALTMLRRQRFKAARCPPECAVKE